MQPVPSRPPPHSEGLPEGEAPRGRRGEASHLGPGAEGAGAARGRVGFTLWCLCSHIGSPGLREMEGGCGGVPTKAAGGRGEPGVGLSLASGTQRPIPDQAGASQAPDPLSLVLIVIFTDPSEKRRYNSAPHF